MRNQIPTSGTKYDLCHCAYPPDPADSATPSGCVEARAAMWSAYKRYVGLALALALPLSGLLIVMGQRPLGKGLVLGTLFGIFNFILIALALPSRLRYGRGKALLFSLTSIYVRYAIMALPLIWALKHDTVALTTTVAGLFMVQIAILGHHLWTKVRDTMR